MASVKKQCEPKMLRSRRRYLDQCDAVLSLACGLGVQAVADWAPSLPVLPGADTTFRDGEEPRGIWRERCHATRSEAV